MKKSRFTESQIVAIRKEGEAGLPLAERFGTSLLVAMRPWSAEIFRKLQREPSRKKF